MVKLKDMENIIGKMETFIKEIFKMIVFMEKEKNIIEMEILNMMVIMLMINMKDIEDIIMKMVNIILVSKSKTW